MSGQGDPDQTAPATGLSETPGDYGFSPGMHVGRYVLGERLGAGGMGVVYAADDPKLDRRVALKLLRPDVSASDTARSQLVHEARTLAKLAHPNVVSVYDVGDFEGRVYLEMELVNGVTLTRWLRLSAHTWRDVLDVFIQAARGLSAAHAVGVVHRDFKPDNLLVGDDGRVRVADFGIALLGEVAAPPYPGEARLATDPGRAADESSVPPHVLRTDGRLAGRTGTPAYMAPEQRRDGKADARSDQYSFCVALHEALLGMRPPEGDAPVSVPDPSRNLRPPPWLEQAVARGLSFDPAQRHATMDALLSVLVSEPRRRRRARRAVATTVGAALLLAAGVVWGNARSAARSTQLCRGAEAKVARIWGQDRRDAVGRAFLATQKPFAKDALAGVTKALDAYTSDWARIRQDACEATRVRHELPERMLDLRMACLDERFAAVTALTDSFSRADADVVVHAFSATQTLPTLAPCSDRTWLEARVKPSADPAIRAQVDAVRAELAHEGVLDTLGKYADALALAKTDVAKATETGEKGVLAEALYREGSMFGRTADFASAEASLKRAASLADAAGDDAVRVEAFGALLYFIVGEAGKADELASFRTNAEAAMARLGGDSPLEARYLQDLASAFLQVGSVPQAIEAQKKSAALVEKISGKESWQAGAVLMNLGIAHATGGEGEEALADTQAGLAIEEKSLGESHPYIASGEATIAWAMMELQKPELAEAHARRAAAIGEGTLGDDQLGRIVGTLGNVLAEEKKYDDALGAFQHALALMSRSHPGEDPVLLTNLTSVGEAYLALEKPALGIPYLERAVALPASGDEAGEARARFYLACCLRDTHGDRKRARALVLAARATTVKLAAGNPDPLLAEMDDWLAKK